MSARKSIFFIGLLIAGFLPVAAQVKFSTIINEKEIGKDEFLQVQYIVENAASVESLTPPAFNGFKVVSGPMQQTGMSVINGAVSKYEAVTYVLKPSSTGKFTIAGANALVDGKPARSGNVTVTITNAAPKSSGGAGNPLFGLSMPEDAPEVDEEYVLRKDENAADKIKNNLFVKLDVSKTTCYAGEPIVATYKLYSRLKSESRVTKRPSLSQFSVYDMVQPEANSPAVENINGKLYNAHIIRKVQLYPLQDGVFDLEPVEVDNTVRFLRLEGGGNKLSMQQLLEDYMNGITNGKMEEQKVTLASRPVTITVKPLPEGKPAAFDGAVGKFTIVSAIRETKIATGETAVLQVNLAGEGNLPLINAPHVPWPAGTEGYEPAVKENIDRTVSPISGTKRFDYSFTAKQAGTIIIPPIEFCYFDPTSKTYKTIATAALTAVASKSVKREQQLHAAVNNTDSTVDWRKFLWLSPLFVLIVMALLFNLKKHVAKDKTAVAPPVTTMDAVPESSAPPDPFEGARFALAAINSQLFYKETGKATWQIVSEQLKLTPSQLNKPVVVRLMQQANTPAETIQLLESVLNDCELALYTPVHTEHGMRHTLEKAERLAQLLTGRNS
ncbi:MAG: BatD family protein [Chitinophagaceae bacterium]